ncbi:MAG: ATP phosphoribosyltransferase [Pseudomonadota bacterium]
MSYAASVATTRKAAPGRVRIAIQKSGRLTDNTLALLGRCGYRYSRGRDDLVCFGENMPVDLLLVRDDDIPGLVAENVCDLGVVGQNVLAEKNHMLARDGRALPVEVRPLRYGHCRLSLAAPREEQFGAVNNLNGKRIATSYPEILGQFLNDVGADASIVELSGAVELAPRLGRADLVCDLVSTGGTLAANGLTEVLCLMQSEAWLVRAPSRHDDPTCRDWMTRLLQRLDGVMQVDESKYIMLHAPGDALNRITSLLPGSETPTVVPLSGNDDKVAVHAVCRENVFWETLENLKAAGASSVLVLPVEKMLL